MRSNTVGRLIFIIAFTSQIQNAAPLSGPVLQFIPARALKLHRIDVLLSDSRTLLTLRVSHDIVLLPHPDLIRGARLRSKHSMRRWASKPNNPIAYSIA